MLGKTSIYSVIKKNGLIDRFLFYIGQLFFGYLRKFNKGKNSNALLIVSLHNLGDTVFTIPAIKNILKHYAGYNIYIICYNESKPIYKIKFSSYQFITINRNEILLKGRICTKNMIYKINNTRPKIIFDITGTITSASLICFSKPEKIYGLKSYYSTRFTEGLYDKLTEIRSTPHLMNTYLDVVLLAIKPDDLVIEKQFDNERKKLQSIFIHPFASRKAKEWDYDKFIELALLLNKKYSLRFIFQKNTITSDMLKKLDNSNLQYIKTETLDDLIKELYSCDLMISNDTGPIQIAALLDKCTFSIYGPTNPVYSVPLAGNHEYINKLIECSPTEKQICDTHGGLYCTHFSCLAELSVEEVYRKLILFIESAFD